jgi:coenzyme F420-reducing hydrogenase gamma subunit
MTELLANPRLCRGCGAAGCTNKCPCKHVYYCGPECQAKDWSRHKKECAVVLDTKVKKEKREHGKDNVRVAAAL